MDAMLLALTIEPGEVGAFSQALQQAVDLVSSRSVDGELVALAVDADIHGPSSATGIARAPDLESMRKVLEVNESILDHEVFQIGGEGVPQATEHLFVHP